MTLRTRLLLPLCLLVIAACSRAEVLNATVPSNGYTVRAGLAYGDHPRQHLDIYIPDRPGGKKPVVLFFYGGSWQSGRKEDYTFVGQAFASKGYVTVVADYRLYPEVRFPAFVADGAQALAWAHKYIDEHEGDANTIFVAGHSAGAYIAVMLAVNDEHIRAAGGDPSWIRGVVGLAGPYHFRASQLPNVKAVFARTPDAAAQPITFVREGAPPMLLATGNDDDDVTPGNTRDLAEKLRDTGNYVEERHYTDLAHLGIVLALADGFRGRAPVLDDIDAFLRSCLQGRPGYGTTDETPPRANEDMTK